MDNSALSQDQNDCSESSPLDTASSMLALSVKALEEILRCEQSVEEEQSLLNVESMLAPLNEKRLELDPLLAMGDFGKALRKFIKIDEEEFPQAEAGILTAEVWNLIGSAPLTDLLRLRKVMRSGTSGSVVIGPRLAKPWLLACLYRMEEKNDMTDEELFSISMDTWDILRAALPSPKVKDDEISTLKTLQGRLKEIGDANRTHQQHVQDIAEVLESDEFYRRAYSRLLAALSDFPDVKSRIRVIFVCITSLFTHLDTFPDSPTVMLEKLIEEMETWPEVHAS